MRYLTGVYGRSKYSRTENLQPIEAQMTDSQNYIDMRVKDFQKALVREQLTWFKLVVFDVDDNTFEATIVQQYEGSVPLKERIELNKPKTGDVVKPKLGTMTAAQLYDAINGVPALAVPPPQPLPVGNDIVAHDMGELFGEPVAVQADVQVNQW